MGKHSLACGKEAVRRSGCGNRDAAQKRAFLEACLGRVRATRCRAFLRESGRGQHVCADAGAAID